MFAHGTRRAGRAHVGMSWKQALRALRGVLVAAVLVVLAHVILATYVREPRYEDALHTLMAVLYCGVAEWAVFVVIDVGARSFLDGIERRLRAEDGANATADAAHVRGLRTQVMLVRRILVALSVVIAIACALVQVRAIRSIGVSLLASAGLAGLVVGLAAQRSIGALLAGVQVTITQPIRVGDVVALEGKIGTIEDIRLTYVVVRIDEDHRLIAPTTRFLDAMFERHTQLPQDASAARGTPAHPASARVRASGG